VEGLALTVWFDNGKKQNFTLDYAFTGAKASQFYLDLQAFEVDADRVPIVIEIREVNWSEGAVVQANVETQLKVCPISGT
jgi:hypothetical protein